MKKKNVAIVGAQGYTGRELVRVLNRHPNAELTGVFTTRKDWCLSYDLPELLKKDIPSYCFSSLNDKCGEFDVIFLATPPEISLDIVYNLISKNITVIDLSPAFRLNAPDFQNTYGIKHPYPELIKKAIYGLVPWWGKQQSIEKCKLIANPGCYATCVLMSLLPLLKHNIIQPDNIVIDAKSGLSGAGKRENKDLLFCEIAGNFYPYKIEGHQHLPEIEKYINNFISIKCIPTMITHLLPIKRGIMISIYADVIDCFKENRIILNEIFMAYKNSYENYNLIKFGEIKEKSNYENMILLSLKNVVGSPRIHVGYFIKNKKILIFASIDNLLKGAASQAVENFNMISNVPIQTGLSSIEGVL